VCLPPSRPKLPLSSMNRLLERIQALPYDFPPGTKTVQLSNLPADIHEDILQMASRVTPIFDARMCDLLRAFLVHKRAQGSSVERGFYTSLTPSKLFTRLLRKRPLSFWGTGDRHVLVTTKNGRQLKSGQWGGFEGIGGDEQQAPFLLDDYLSYDEMQLSALISVVVPTLFVNSGSRDSKCLPGERGSFQEFGVIVACVGARMVKDRRMEAEHMLITPECDLARGYGRQQGPNDDFDSRLAAWAQFYDIEYFPSYAEAAAEYTKAAKEKRQGRYYCIQSQCQCCWQSHDTLWTDEGWQCCQECRDWWYGWNGETPPALAPNAPSYLDGLVYKRRIRATVEPFLVFASQLGEEHRASSGQGALVRVKGLGLGCWWVTPVQEMLMKQVYAEVIAERQLSGIDILEFAFFPSEHVPAGSGRIEVRASKCSFAEPVGRHLLIAMYAWDGNAHPGNEWWAEDGSGRYLTMSDDSAAASCSLITSLQHPAVNVERHSAASAKMLTREGALVDFLE